MERNAWHIKYLNRPEFLSWFETEQEYVDVMFMHIVMFNFGVHVNIRKDEESVEGRATDSMC